MAKVVRRKMQLNDGIRRYQVFQFIRPEGEYIYDRFYGAKFCKSAMMKLFDVNRKDIYNLCVSKEEPAHGESYAVMKFRYSGVLHILDADGYGVATGIPLHGSADDFYEDALRLLHAEYEDTLYVWVEET